MKYKIRFPHDPSMVEKLGEAYWTETFTPEEFESMTYQDNKGNLTFVYDDVEFELEVVKVTDKKEIYWAERVWY